jgi:hypothetical protein
VIFDFGFRISAFGFALLLLLSQPSILHSQTAPSPNRVLQLDGTNCYVQLPPNIFDTLTQATVEGWVKWGSLRTRDRLFDFGDRGREMYVRPDGAQLNFLVASPDGTRHRIEVAGILRAREWCHIAAVTGPGGARLYFNGRLVGTNAYTGSFSTWEGQRKSLGNDNYASGSSTTDGQIEEVRVWDHVRTPEQMRETMF